LAFRVFRDRSVAKFKEEFSCVALELVGFYAYVYGFVGLGLFWLDVACLNVSVF